MSQYFVIYTVLKILYREVLRNLIKQYVDDPSTDWDDLLLKILDSVFDYQEE